MTTTNAKLKCSRMKSSWLSDTRLRKSYSQRQNQKRRTRTANCDPSNPSAGCSSRCHQSVIHSVAPPMHRTNKPPESGRLQS